MMTACRACTTLNGQGPKTPPHPRLQLIRRRRHQALLALFFQCRTCEAELSYLPGLTPDQHGWRMFFDPATRLAQATALPVPLGPVASAAAAA